jgi:hypothetical protein
VQGITGATSLQAYAYIYNQSAQTVLNDTDVTFDSQGPSLVGFTNTPGTAPITVTNAGTYLITFSVSSSDANQFAIYVNGALAPGSVYGAGAGNQTNIGQVQIAFTDGDTFTLHNTTGADITLPNPIPAGGTQTTVNASIDIIQVA